MSTPLDPKVDLPGTPDPGPDPDETSAKPGPGAPDRKKDAGMSKGDAVEAEEPIDNRFPDVEGGDQRESG